MSRLMNQFRHMARKFSFVADDRGLSTVEYVIILVLIAAAAVGTWSTFGSTITKKINDSNEEITSGVVIDGKASDGAGPSKSPN